MNTSPRILLPRNVQLRVQYSGTIPGLRQYFSKGTDVSAQTPDRLQIVAHQLNRRPKAVLGGRTAAEPFSALLPFPDHLLMRP